MKLSLTEAARALGRSPRQIRYAIRAGTLPGQKVAGRWILDGDDLPLTEGQQRARERKATALAETVHAALAPHLNPKGRKTFSVRDLLAFDHALGACREATSVLVDAEHPATRALREALISLTRGCHRYHAEDKRDAFREAREQAAAAVAHLYLAGAEPADALALRVERDLLPVLAGLLRRSEREGHRPR